MKSCKILFLCLIPILASCQTIDGPKFRTVEVPPNDKALVYIYKPVAYGKSIYLLSANREPVTKLMKGGYYPYYASPGNLELVADKRARIGELLEVLDIEPDKKLTLNVETGKIYYVKISGALIVRLSQVDEATALDELSKCKRLPTIERN